MKSKKVHLILLTLLTFIIGAYNNGVAQDNNEVSGTVTDANTDEVLPGVNITIKGTTAGTTTGADGNYTISVESLADTLVFSFVGFGTQEIPIGGRTTVDVSLETQAISGDELVVVGYGAQTRESITGSISNVSSEDLERTSSLSTSDALVGRVQGVTARKADARPGASTAIQIRNMGEPLYVVDGVSVSAEEFNQLGQNDIKDISILKDASAAVYGLRASNGVVLVETKDGNFGEQQTEINLTGYYGVQNFTRYPQPANAYQYQRAKVESDQNQGNTPSISREELERWREGGGDYKSYNYYDIVMDPFVPEYTVGANVSGGAENVKYYFSVTHADEDALISDYNYNRTNIQANIDGKLSDKLTVGTQLSGRIQDRNHVGVPGYDDYFNPQLTIFSMWPIERPYANDNPDYVHQTHNVNVNPATYTKDIAGWQEEITRAFKGNFFAEYNFDFGLTAKGTFSYGYRNYFFNGFEYTYDAYRYDEENDEYYTEPGWGNQNPWREQQRDDGVDRFAQFQLSYNGEFGDHTIAALAAYERQDQSGQFRVVHTVPSTNQIPIQYFSEQDVLGHDINVQARAGYVGRVNYDYQNKYLIEVLGRYDGSFLFPPEDRWGLFPGVSVGWRISEESFFTSDLFTDLKLRASYGKTGSETWVINGEEEFIVPPFSYVAGYDFQSGGAIFDGEQIIGTEPRGLPITNLSWIENITMNIGVDVALLEDKLSGTFDIFERQREGLPAPRYDVLLPVEVGYTLPNENLNSDAHRGIEGSLTYTDNYGKVGYSIGVNATFARERSLNTYKPRFANSWDKYRNSIEDRWSNVNWGYQVVGRFQSEEQIENYAVNIDGQGNRTLLPGDFIYKDVNNDGIINEMDERPIGYAQGENPYLNYGINGSVSYKNFDLNFSFVGGSMQSWTRNWEVRYPFQNNGNSPEYMFEDRWHREDPYDNNSPWVAGTYPAIREGNNNHSNYRHNDFWLTNVRYLRLRNLEVSYDLSQDLLERVGFKGLRITAKGTNLLTFDNVKEYGVDPEISSDNALQYPQQRFFSLGFDLTL